VSALSPILFNIYTAKIGQTRFPGQYLQYVDDIILYTARTTQQDIIPQLHKGLNNVFQALHETGLHIHQTKITNVIFSQYKKDNALHRYHYEDNIIPKKQITKFLGVYSDTKLSWKLHIMHVVNQCNAWMAILRKVVMTS
jgi:hypothetical protein